MYKWINITETKNIKPGSRYFYDLDDTTIIIFNINDNFYAIDHLCTHAHFSLEDGDLEGETIECPLHGAKFCLRTGDALTPPACENLQIYKTQIIDGILQLQIEE